MSNEIEDVLPKRRTAKGIRSGRREDLRNTAIYQKGILVCILIYFVLVIAQFGIPPELRFLIGLVAIPVILTSTVFVFLLAIQVYNVGLGILFGVLTLVPCLGLIMLLIINSKATTILRENGIDVGLMGANLSQVQDASGA